MSKEQKTQSLFNDALNEIHKVVGNYVKQMQPILSRDEENDRFRISIRALCKHPGCNKPVMASIFSSEEQWGQKLVDTFIMRAEYHYSKHAIIPTTRLPKRIGGH